MLSAFVKSRVPDASPANRKLPGSDAASLNSVLVRRTLQRNDLFVSAIAKVALTD